MTVTTRLNKRSVDRILAWILLFLGCTGLGYVLSQPLLAPQSSSKRPAVSRTMAPDAQPAPSLSASKPTSLDIPAISVSTNLIELGKNDDGSMETPSEYEIAGWYRYSPTPGEIGPSVITGHVDSYLGPAIFFRLKELQQNDAININRQDGSTVTFRVDSVAVFEQTNFPTEAVYGNIEHAGLRLITCGGTYDAISGRYSHNVVVYATYAR